MCLSGATYSQTVISLSLHYKNQTKPPSQVQSGHHRIKMQLVLAMI